MSKEIFVFGSNLKGIHGAGAALVAREQYGAELGVGEGRTGNAYAIPTKRDPKTTLSVNDILPYALRFLDYARANPKLTFKLTAIGCGFAGYRPTDIAWMFEDAPPNVHLPEIFAEVLGHQL